MFLESADVPDVDRCHRMTGGNDLLMEEMFRRET